MTRHPLPRAVRASAALTAAALAVPLLSSPTGAVSRAESYTVPATASFTDRRARLRPRPRDVAVRREGGRAQGAHHGQILAFYYPGTDTGEDAGWLRVRITDHTSNDLVVLAQPGLVLRDRATRKDYPLPGNLGATQWRLSVSGTEDRRRLQVRRPGTATGQADWPRSQGDGAFRAPSGRSPW